MMIEYIAAGSEFCPMLLIYGRDWNQCQTLCDSCGNLAAGKVKRVALHSLPGFECVGGCELWAKVSVTDAGIAQPASGSQVFECVLSRKAWARMAELLEPLCRPQPEETDIFHQLDRTGPISLLVSTARDW